jgi:predicted phosphodiesterase
VGVTGEGGAVTRIAIITDVHADLIALRDALEQIDRLGCEMIVCCGDLIDYGLFPEETITLIRERKILCIRGNHDRWAVAEGHDCSGWDLTSGVFQFLSALRVSMSIVVDGTAIAVHHARPGDDMNGIYPPEGPHAERDTASLLGMSVVRARNQMVGHLHAIDALVSPRILIVGHTHVPMYRSCADGIIVNPGALLRDPVDDHSIPPAVSGTFGVLEPSTLRFAVYRADTGETVLERP